MYIFKNGFPNVDDRLNSSKDPMTLGREGGRETAEEDGGTLAGLRSTSVGVT